MYLHQERFESAYQYTSNKGIKHFCHNVLEDPREKHHATVKPSPPSKAGLYPKKVMLCIWWDWKGVLYYEVLPHNQAINSSLLRTTGKVKGSIGGNSSPNISLMTRQKLIEFCLVSFLLPPHPPDLALLGGFSPLADLS